MAIRRPVEDDLVALQLVTRASSYAYAGSLVHSEELTSTPSTAGRVEGVRAAALVKDHSTSGGVNRVIRATPVGSPPFPLDSDKRRATMFATLQALRHPCVSSVLSCEFARDRACLIVVRPCHKKGSLRDAIYHVPEQFRFCRKRAWPKSHSTAGWPMSEQDVSFYGRHIVEGLLYFRSVGFPYPYLHTGNVLFTETACALGDYEDIVAGVPPFYAKILASPKLEPCHYDLVCLGMTLYEMSTGVGAPEEGIQTTAAPQYIEDTLRLIFPSGIIGKITDPPVVTLEELLTKPVFGRSKSKVRPEADAIFRGPFSKAAMAFLHKLAPAAKDIVCGIEKPKVQKQPSVAASTAATSAATTAGDRPALRQSRQLSDFVQRPVSMPPTIFLSGPQRGPGAPPATTTTTTATPAPAPPPAAPPAPTSVTRTPPPPPPPASVQPKAAVNPPKAQPAPPAPPPQPTAAAATPPPPAQPGRSSLLEAIRSASMASLKHVETKTKRR